MIRFDSVPWPSRISLDGNVLTISRNVQHSGSVVVAYPIPNVGEIAVRTGTLPERVEPYHLAIELARGMLDRLRNQLSLWEEGGLQLAAQVHEQIEQATNKLADAILGTREFAEQNRLAEESLAISWPAMLEMVRQFALQVGPVLDRDETRDQTLGARLPAHPVDPPWPAELDSTFSYVSISGWRDVAIDAQRKDTALDLHRRAIERSKQVIVGPIWDAGLHGLPAEINETVDFEAKRLAALKHFHQILGTISEPPDWLHLVSGLNGVGHRFLSFPQQIQLVADLQNLVDEYSSNVPILISFDQPWGERLAWSVGGAQSIQIADMLLRHDIRVSGFGLEFNLDYWPHGTLARDPLQWIDLIDMWSQFGMPLIIFLRAPFDYSAKDITGSGSDRVMTIRDSLNPQQRSEYLTTIASVVLSRPLVRSIVWCDWYDENTGPFPAAGLYTQDNRPKPSLEALQSAFQWTRKQPRVNET